MKKQWMILSLVLLGATVGPAKSQDPITLVIQQGIKQVIVAVDLKIQRLQNEVIWLQNAQKVVENALSKIRLEEITDWVSQQRALYAGYFNELWKVKGLISYYHRVRDMIDRQHLLVAEYKTAWRGVQQDRHFAPEEVEYIGRVYTGIIEESVRNLEQVTLLIRSFSLQMTDAKRLEAIDAVAMDMQQNYDDLKAFNRQNILLSLQLAKDEQDVITVKKLYHLQ